MPLFRAARLLLMRYAVIFRARLRCAKDAKIMALFSFARRRDGQLPRGFDADTMLIMRARQPRLLMPPSPYTRY